MTRHVGGNRNECAKMKKRNVTLEEEEEGKNAALHGLDDKFGFLLWHSLLSLSFVEHITYGWLQDVYTIHIYVSYI